MNTFKLLIIILLNAISLNLVGQQYEYNRVSVELLQMKECDFDPDASAMVTYNYGHREILYTENEWFRSELRHQKQVKYFKGDSKDIANIEIFFYSPKVGSGNVKITDIKGKTYNFVNNEIVKTELKADNIYTVQFNNYLKKTTLVMANIQDGAVFEYEYLLISDYITNIEDWNIQDDIPVKYSKLTTSTPEYFTFQINTLGGSVPTLNENSNSRKTINIKYSSNSENRLMGRNNINENFNLNYNIKTLVFEDIPAKLIEPFVASEDEGISKVTHQLVAIAFPNTAIINYATSYEKISEELLEDASFGKVVRNGDFMKTT